MFIVSFLSSLYRYNDGSIPSTATADGNTLTLSAPSVDDSGNYTCSFRNASYTFALMINPAPPSPTTNRNSKKTFYLFIFMYKSMYNVSDKIIFILEKFGQQPCTKTLAPFLSNIKNL